VSKINVIKGKKVLLDWPLGRIEVCPVKARPFFAMFVWGKIKRAQSLKIFFKRLLTLLRDKLERL
jgi:hypothetical protein